MDEYERAYAQWLAELEAERQYIVYVAGILPDFTREEAYAQVKLWDAEEIDRMYDLCTYIAENYTGE